ncbi:alpha/beta fold hydrolase [Atopomonas sediminilitoris]|uniref:alpha/beta fold hydrolase n=1 Tax=Atopomonas sediminilitoris TaxID=2919919 RepID=UPI001F4E9F05|nr:alpha/beta hydrolase [Atopomonas sediminilitoris]MCJ8169349.1 alpha/beta hydrolase [Atopomonas sediminilitoris]
MLQVDLPQGTWRYERYGSGSPVLLLHGLGSARQDWQAQWLALSQDYLVICVDLPGHGEGRRLLKRTALPELVTELAAFVEALALGPCAVVGMSMGGMYGFELLAQRPDLVTRLVAINSAPHFPVDTWQIRSKLWLRERLVRWFGLSALASSLAKKLFPYPQQAALREQLVARISANRMPDYLNALHAFPGWSALPRLKALPTPILVVSGDRDYTPLAFKQAYVAQLANARLEVVADSGHATPLDQPAALNQLLQGFLLEPMRSKSPAA